MIRFRKIYLHPDSDAEELDLPAQLNRLTCELSSQNLNHAKPDLDRFAGYEFGEVPPRPQPPNIFATQLGVALNTVSTRQLPIYSLAMTVSNHLDEKTTAALIRFGTFDGANPTVTEHVMAPVAVYHSFLNGKEMQWSLIAAGLIKEFSLNRSFDTLDGGTAEIALSIYDLRLDTSFLELVDVNKIGSPGQISEQKRQEPNPQRNDKSATKGRNR